MTPYLIHHFLEHHAQALPEQFACIHGDEAVSYGEMERAANRVAHLLRDLGVRRGDRVALLIENSSAYVAAYYGILKCGGVTVAMYSTTPARTLAYIVNDCAVSVLLTQSKQLPVLEDVRDQLPKLRAVLVLDALPGGKVSAPEDLQEGDTPRWPWPVTTAKDIAQQPETPLPLVTSDLNLASIIYTSGSTGDPRGAMLSHLNIVANTRSIVSYLCLTAQDRVMVVLPFAYVYGKSLLNTHMAVGGTVIIDNRFVFPNVVLQTMQEKAATGFSGVPSTYAILLGKSAVRKMEFPALRYLTQAGGAMAPALIREVMEVFLGRRIFIMYGATEASARLSYLPPEELPRKVGSIGIPIPNVELRVIKENGEEAALGEAGEIVARGANIMQGYWNQPEETKAALTTQGFHTGDLGRMDEEGFFYVVGRKRDMIKSGANRVSPKEIEETILEHALVLEAAVIGVPDQYLGEAICAYITLKPGHNNGHDEKVSEEIISFCRQRLPEFKVPRQVIVHGKLPKNASGKVMKEELRSLHKASPVPQR
jgi:acyl-CoA synthetase (AMP-forming)/AMP-acid ligase II